MRRILNLGLVLVLAACAQTASVPTVPDTDPVTGSEIRGLVEGGPYEVTIVDGNDAGTVARLLWDFAAGTVSGDFVTAEGQTGTFSTPMRVVGDQLCVGDGEAGCHFVYEIEGGFMEVNEDGTVHAVSRRVG